MNPILVAVSKLYLGEFIVGPLRPSPWLVAAMGEKSMHRVSLDLNGKMKDTLDELACFYHKNLAGTLRMAIGLLKVAAEAEKNGQIIALVNVLDPSIPPVKLFIL